MTPAKGYTEMKDSGIEWIGEIPNHWKVGKVKNVFSATKTIVGNDVDSYQRLALTLNGVVKRSKADDTGLQPEKFETYQILRPNELVFKLIDLQNISTSRVGRSSYEGIVSPAYIVLHEKFDRSTKFAEYFFLAMWMHQIFNQLGADGVRSNIGTSALLNLPFIIVPNDEQSAIASFLDTQCAKIDEIIAQAKASIEDYKQWKASIIYEAVTKGLDPNVEMKDSGIEWVGKVPTHWLLKKAKYCVFITNGSDPKTEGNTPVYGSGADSFKTCGEYKNGPAVLIGRKGATLHIPHYIEGRYWNVDTAFDVKAKKEFSLRYYYYLACVFDYNYYISQTTLPGMTQTNYNNMKLPCPSLEEQSTIATYLDTQCAKIDELVVKKQSLIDDLESYKKSLIYEVVTGKRRV